SRLRFRSLQDEQRGAIGAETEGHIANGEPRDGMRFAAVNGIQRKAIGSDGVSSNEPAIRRRCRRNQHSDRRKKSRLAIGQLLQEESFPTTKAPHYDKPL